MTGPTRDELLTIWASRAATSKVGQADNRHRTALRRLADGHPVAAHELAEATGEPVSEVRAWLEQMRTGGYEIDEQGRLIGAALALRPTGNRFRVRGKNLYAWCGFDTLFLPILLDEPAEVVSTCPVTGQPVTLDVAADGTVTAVRPDSTVVAIVGSSVISSCATVGPDSAVCTQMPFLADRAAGEQWLASHPGVAIVDLDVGTQVARAYASQPDCCC